MKRQASFKEYTVTIADSGSVEVYKLFKNALKGLREFCEANKIDYPEYMGAQKLGTKLLKEQNGGDATAVSAIVGQYIVSCELNNGIKVSKIYKNTSGALRELSELVGFDYDAKWGPRTFGNKVIDAIESGEFSKLARAKKVEETVEIEMDEDTTTEAAAPQVAAQETPADAVVLEPADPTEIGCGEYREKDFKSVVIPEGVTKIDRIAFRNCTSLESVFIPNSVTKIDSSTFSGCEKLKIVWGDAFLQQDGVVYSSDRTMIMQVTNPVNIVLLETLAEIPSHTFSNCTSLESIVIPESVSEIEYNVFENCTSLKSIVIPNSVTEIGQTVFGGCTSLKEIILSNNITEINAQTFKGCTSLESIVIPEGVTKICWDAFKDCTSLKSIIIPDSMIDIDSSAFNGCDKLDIRFSNGLYQQDGIVYSKDKTSIVYVSNPVNVVLLDSLTNINYRRFLNCTSLQSIVIPESVTELKTKVFGDCTSLESVVIPESVTEIADNVFSGCTSLENIIIPKSVTDIGDDVFEDCDNLKSITIFKKIKKSIKKKNLPRDCQVIIVDQDISKTTVSLVPCENAVFTSEDYEKMGRPEDLEIPEGYIAIADNAFEDCEDLERVVIPEGVTHIGKFAFYNCSNLESVTLPNSLNTVGNFAFGGDDVCTMERDYEYDELVEDCGVLCNADRTNILFIYGEPYSYDIGEDITSIGQKFNNCESIETIDFCDSQVEELEGHAFDGCYAMESIYLNNNLKKIENNVFYSTKITELVIPNSVTEIGKNAFMECCSLTKITLPEMFKDKLSDFIVEDWDEISLADEKYEVSFH